ncbi:MAG: glycosyltransferase family 2 protein [Rhodoferax sp.]
MRAGLYPYSAAPTPRQGLYDVAVILPTIGRWTTLQAIESVYAQTHVGAIQLLVGVDVQRADFLRIEQLLQSPPPHVDVLLFYPGYSTSVRHGGVHTSGSGGALRTILSYMAHSKYLCYLDDDNWWAPEHLSGLLKAVQGKHWAYAGRRFVHPERDDLQCVDDWESVGLGAGVFAAEFGGWVDPNCLILDKTLCADALGLWSVARTLTAHGWGLASDRRVFAWLMDKPVGTTGTYSVYYRVRPDDPNFKNRVHRLKPVASSDYFVPRQHGKQSVAMVIVCKGRLAHLQQSLPLVAAIEGLQVIVVDDDCPDHAGEWVTQHHPGVQVVRPASPLPFNLARARNLGAAAVEAPWIVFMDADVVVRPAFAQWLAQQRDPDCYYCSGREDPELRGSFVCTTRAFQAAGGYDENFRGWGGEDSDLYRRLEKAGYAKALIPGTLWSPIRHDDALRFAYDAGAPSKAAAILRTHLYASIKYDLEGLGLDFFKQSQAELILERIHASAQAVVARTAATDIAFDLGQRRGLLMVGGYAVRRRISYHISEDASTLPGGKPGPLSNT